jgi:hypothetical protein
MMTSMRAECWLPSYHAFQRSSRHACLCDVWAAFSIPRFRGEPGAGGQFDEGVETELVDLATKQIVEPWLRHAETLGGRRLGEVP